MRETSQGGAKKITTRPMMPRLTITRPRIKSYRLNGEVIFLTGVESTVEICLMQEIPRVSQAGSSPNDILAS